MSVKSKYYKVQNLTNSVPGSKHYFNRVVRNIFNYDIKIDELKFTWQKAQAQSGLLQICKQSYNGKDLFFLHSKEGDQFELDEISQAFLTDNIETISKTNMDYYLFPHRRKGKVYEVAWLRVSSQSQDFPTVFWSFDQELLFNLKEAL